MNLQVKTEVLNKLPEGVSSAAVGRLFLVTESSVQSMKKKENEIFGAVMLAK